MPGAEPAAGDDAARASLAGSKKMRSRGPASSKVGMSASAWRAVARARAPIVEQHALGLADVVQGRRAQPGGERRFDEAPPQRP